MKTMEPNLNAALDYAARGFAVFPLCWPVQGQCGCGKGHAGRDIGKAPITPHGLLDSATDVKLLNRYWVLPDANVGIRTGLPSGIVVLDIDGVDGEQTLKGVSLPKTPTVITGRGRHLYFKHPYLETGESIGNAVKFLPGCDFRGDGGYVVAPPSKHLDGNTYTWASGLSLTDVCLAEVPEWMLQGIIDHRGDGGVRSADRWRELISAEIAEGSRNMTMTSLAGLLLRRYVDAFVVLDLLLAYNAQRCVPPLEDDEIVRIVDSVAGIELKRRDKDRVMRK